MYFLYKFIKHKFHNFIDSKAYHATLTQKLLLTVITQLLCILLSYIFARLLLLNFSTIMAFISVMGVQVFYNYHVILITFIALLFLSLIYKKNLVKTFIAVSLLVPILSPVLILLGSIILFNKKNFFWLYQMIVGYALIISTSLLYLSNISGLK